MTRSQYGAYCPTIESPLFQYAVGSGFNQYTALAR